MDDDKHLFQPLLATVASSYSDITAAASLEEDNDAEDNIKFLSSNTSIIFRLLSVILIGVISVLADHEASKGFDVTIVNDVKDSEAGKRFHLFYVSNDQVTRILLNTSSFVEKVLYPDDGNQTKKNVRRVTLRLNGMNTTQMSAVGSSKSDEFYINVSPSIMEDENVKYAIISAIQHGMARIWLWDGESRAPPLLIDGLVEYISMLAGFGAKNFVGGDELPEFSQLCWDDKEPRGMAEFLDFCEVNNKGFIQRLNQALRYRWDNQTVHDALGMKAKYLCDSYKAFFVV